MSATEAIVLVGGLGTRLRSEIADLPKPLAPVAGRPFLAYLLDHLRAQGIRRAILAAGYLHEMVRDRIGSNWDGMEVAYSIEPSALGTGGAIALAAGQLQGEGVHVSNGDTYLRFDLRVLEATVAAQGASIGMALARVDDVERYGAVEIRDGHAIGFREKGGHGPGFINAGSYFLTAGALETLPRTGAFSFETQVLVPAAAAGRVAVIEQSSDFIDIGVPEDYRRAQLQFDAS